MWCALDSKRNGSNSLIAEISLGALNNYEATAFDIRQIIEETKPFSIVSFRNLHVYSLQPRDEQSLR